MLRRAHAGGNAHPTIGGRDMTKSRSVCRWLSFGVGLTLLALTSARAVAAEKSLYDRLGGEKAISAVVDDFVARAAADPKVNFMRDGKVTNVDVPKLKQHLVNLVGQLTGGPQKYTGGSMKDVHKGMKITD